MNQRLGVLFKLFTHGQPALEVVFSIGSCRSVGVTVSVTTRYYIKGFDILGWYFSELYVKGYCAFHGIWKDLETRDVAMKSVIFRGCMEQHSIGSLLGTLVTYGVLCGRS